VASSGIHEEDPTSAGLDPRGFVVVPLGKACLLVIPERVYVAKLRLGRTVRMASYFFGFCSR
jgi:hypothetical protein